MAVAGGRGCTADVSRAEAKEVKCPAMQRTVLPSLSTAMARVEKYLSRKG